MSTRNTKLKKHVADLEKSLTEWREYAARADARCAVMESLVDQLIARAEAAEAAMKKETLP